MSEEIKIITLGDIFKNIETEAQAFKFLGYIKDLQQKVEQLEKENEYLKMSNPEQNMEHFRIVNENKRKIDMLRKENHQLKNIRKEAIEYIENNWITYNDSKDFTEFNEELPVFIKEINILLNILNKGSKYE